MEEFYAEYNLVTKHQVTPIFFSDPSIEGQPKTREIDRAEPER